MIYPIGIQSFESLRNDGYVYIDKTALVYKLATEGRYYFLSRPRRFGKSLLISTFEAYFSGKRELFEGLAIEKLEQKWESYPILHMDLNTGKYLDKENLASVLNDTLVKWEQQYGREDSETTFGLRFKGIVERAAVKSGQRVVILVDEYDKPMLQSIGNDELQAEFRTTLKEFYSVLKTQDRYIKFAFLTGVTKFGKVSVFSDLNNLRDISMDYRYVDICGISEAEIHTYFEDEIRKFAEFQNTTYDNIVQTLRIQYDGYHFCENSIGIYNPFSLLNALDSKTIKDYDERFGTYILGFPNQEVERGFIKYLLPFYTPRHEKKSEFYVNEFISDVERGNVEQFLTRL